MWAKCPHWANENNVFQVVSVETDSTAEYLFHHS